MLLLRSRLLLVACAAAAALFSLPARAALFEDDEARRAILELRDRLDKLEDAQRKQPDQVQALVQQQLDPLRRSVLDLNNQIEALRADLAKLRGDNEELARALADTQRKLADQNQSVDARLRPLEPQKVTVDGSDFQVAPEERAQYEAAMGMVRRGDFAAAADAFGSFLRAYPASGYLPSVRYWLGNAQFGNRAYKDAAASFKTFLAENAQHPRAPEAMLALANCQIELKDVKLGRRSLQDLIKTYPNSDAAQAAKQRLSSLK
ncbi:MAG: tol-pal system protein YbgF [Pelomonas sp.]|nr:tol-pal system protein YbgF [Roseateles sp.]